MVISAIFILFVGFSVLQPNKSRTIACCVFTLFTLMCDIFLSELDGLAYYCTAAIVDLAIIIVLSGIRPACRTVKSLQLVSGISILSNFAGWLLWYWYFPPTIYNFAYLIIYSYVLIIMLRRTRNDDGYYTISSWSPRLFFDRYTRLFSHNTNEGSK